MKVTDKAVPFALALVILVALTAAPALSARSGCRATLHLGGSGAAANGRSARCRDGDPACDGDGAADGGCDFRASVCFDRGGASCDPQDVKGASVLPGPGFEGVVAALDALKADAAPVCTAPASVRVATHGRRRRKAVLKMLNGKAAERLTFVCRPARKPSRSASFATIQKRIFDATCATPSCHGAAAAAGGLDLAAGAAYGNLVGVSAANPSAQAAGVLRVVPGDPDRSFLLRKLLGQLGAGEGSRMPLVGTPLSPSSLDLVRRWIAAGAPETAAF